MIFADDDLDRDTKTPKPQNPKTPWSDKYNYIKLIPAMFCVKLLSSFVPSTGSLFLTSSHHLLEYMCIASWYGLCADSICGNMS